MKLQWLITIVLALAVAAAAAVLGTGFRSWAGTVKVAVDKIDDIVVLAAELNIKQAQDELWKERHTERPHEEATRRIDRNQIELEQMRRGQEQLMQDLREWGNGLRASIETHEQQHNQEMADIRQILAEIVETFNDHARDHGKPEERQMRRYPENP